MFKANMRKEFLELRRYLPNTIAVIITFYIIFLGLFLGIKVIGDSGTEDYNVQYMIVSYIFWFMATMVLQHIGGQITSEAMRGTLEQLYMSPLGVWRIMAARLISSLIMYFIIISILLYFTMLTTNQWLNIDVFSLFPIMFLTFISMCGVGYMIAGISIIWKQIGAFLQIIQFIIAGLAVVPLTASPILSYLPFVKGIDLIRNIMINGITWNNIALNDYISLTLNAMCYLLIGLLIFKVCERIAISRALLSHY